MGGVRACPDDAKSLMVAGHEPTCSSLVSMLVGGCELQFPTAALARIDLPITAWKNAGSDTGVLVWFVHPRLLDSIGL